MCFQDSLHGDKIKCPDIRYFCVILCYSLPIFFCFIAMATLSELFPLGQHPEKSTNCQYTIEERKVLNQWKKDYIIQTSPSTRRQIFRSQILPGIFEYWRSIGRSSESSDVSAYKIKVLDIINFYRMKESTYILSQSVTCRVPRKQLATYCKPRISSKVKSPIHRKRLYLASP